MSFNPKAVRFDGAADSYAVAGLIGEANGKLGIVNFNIKPLNLDLTVRIIDFGSSFFYMNLNSDGQIKLVGYNAVPAVTLDLRSDNGVATSGEWVHIVASWDVGNGASHFYANNTEVNNELINANANIEYTRNAVAISAQYPGAALLLPAAISEFYLNITEYIDLSVEANRRKFISASGKPVPLGTRGATPTGTKPIVYMSNDYPGVNLGTGGHFDVNGSPQVVEGPNPVVAASSGLDLSLLEFFPDTIGIEPFLTMTAQQVFSYGASVPYQSQITGMSERVIAPNGREVTSTSRVIIPQRVFIDPRSRITLPESFVPRTPPILGVRPVGGALGLDHTEILL